MRDVMRGEETQVFGALAQLGATDGRFLLPGTHSKWVRVEAGRIDRLRHLHDRRDLRRVRATTRSSAG